MARPEPPLSAGLGPGRSAPGVQLTGGSRGSASPPSASGAPVSRTRPAPASCHLTRGRPLFKSRPRREAGGAGWGPRVVAPPPRRGGRLRPCHRLGHRAGRLAARYPSLPPPSQAGSSGSARPAAALPHPPARPSPRETGAPEAASPAPKPQCRRAPALTAIMRPGHAQSVNLVRGGHGGRARVSTEEAVRP